MTNKIRGGGVGRGVPDTTLTSYLYIDYCILVILYHIRRPSGPAMPGPLHNTFWEKYD